MQTAAPDSLVGRTLEGRYRILDRIARGGMSTVYSAIDERLDRLVAVKVMSAALSADPAFIDRFAREARAAARLAHVNAVAVYDQGQDETDGHHVFLVMELVEGRTLRELIRERNGKFTPAEAISIMEPVLAALAAAHRAGLVHRDIKPENILLSDDGLVKVADFGLARALDSDVASTRTGLMMGTVAYCAPEQITGGQSDQRSDVYAAGIVLFELLTGRPPYSGDSAMNVAYQHVHSRVPAPSSQVKGIPNEIDELVINATDPSPATRPADAGAFLAEIAEIRADLNLPITPIPQRPRLNRTGASEVLPTVRPMGADTSRTEYIDGSGRSDTQVVPRRDSGHSAVPPATVTPAGRGGVSLRKSSRGRALSPRQRRRRRTIIGIVAVALLGIGSAVGGILLVDWYEGWNHHVPKLAGDSLAEATQALKNDGYKLGATSYQYSDVVQPGQIISTNPGAGARLDKGKPVAVVVSRGQHFVLIPSVTGMSLSDAEAKLTQVGFTFGPSPSQQNSTTVPKGKVIGTDPKAGEKVLFGKPVTLIVSSGPPLVTLPTLTTNEAFTDYSAALTALHVKVSRTDDFSDTVPPGDVISATPSSGQVAVGSTVTVTVSKGPQFVQVPKIKRGDSGESAKAALEAVGLVCKFDTSVDGGVFDKVFSVSPHSGQMVPAGSTVTVVLF